MAESGGAQNGLRTRWDHFRPILDIILRHSSVIELCPRTRTFRVMVDQMSRNPPFSLFVPRFAGTSGGGTARGEVASGPVWSALSNGPAQIVEFQRSGDILFIGRNVKSMETKTTWVRL